ncbi:MAG: hypothetical protein RTU30_11350 [Candidatus Thorarchaeota archaeon]
METVYPEKSLSEERRIYGPLIIGGVIAITSTAVSLILLDSLEIEIVFMFIIIPMLIGTLLTIVAGVSAIRNEKRYGVRGITRTMMSQAIHFLDMVQQGFADIGRVTDSPRPDELTATTTLGFGSAVYVLKRIDADLAKMWTSTLSEKLGPEISSKSIWFLRITIYGTLAAIPILLITCFLHIIGVIVEEVFKILVIIVSVTLIVLVSALIVYVIVTSNAEAPQGVLDALAEPQLRFNTEMALDRIIQAVQEEGQHPLRVLVLGEYEGLTYTKLTYTTSREHKLKAAVLFPMH